jgi:hypothetical protein
MASRGDILHSDNYSLLEELLKEVGKEGLVKTEFSSSCSYNELPFGTSSVVQPLHKKDLLQVKSFLGEVSGSLTAENVHDMCQFFDGACDSINYQSIKSGEKLFSKLLEGKVISVGNLYPLQQVLYTIGRLDLSSSIETFSASTSTGDYNGAESEYKIINLLMYS